MGPQFLLPVAKILDPLMVYDNINLGRRIDPVWPKSEWRVKGGRNSWNNWIPMEDMQGVVLHRWTPMHPSQIYRSHTDKTILLLKIEDKYVPIAEHGVEIIYQDNDDCGSTHASPGSTRTGQSLAPESKREHTPVHDLRLRKRSGNKSEDSSRSRSDEETSAVSQHPLGAREKKTRHKGERKSSGDDSSTPRREERSYARKISGEEALSSRRKMSGEEVSSSRREERSSTRKTSGEEGTSSSRREEKHGVRTLDHPLSVYLRSQSERTEDQHRGQESDGGDRHRHRGGARDQRKFSDPESSRRNKQVGLTVAGHRPAGPHRDPPHQVVGGGGDGGGGSVSAPPTPAKADSE